MDVVVEEVEVVRGATLEAPAFEVAVCAGTVVVDLDTANGEAVDAAAADAQRAAAGHSADHP